MFRNYLKLAWRNLVKNKVYSIIIVSGLTLAFSACLVIFLFVREETSYDKQSPDSALIRRVVKDFVNDDGTALPDATTPPAVAPALQNDIPQIASVMRVFPSWGSRRLVNYEDKSFYEARVYRADSNFFSFFNIPLIEGDPNTALVEPNSVVITRSIAEKYFGTMNALGKQLKIGEGDESMMAVTGIINDLPSNMHFHFDILLPHFHNRDIDTNWGWYNFYTYIKLKPGTSIPEVDQQIVAVYKKNRPEGSARYYSQAITDIHLTSKLKWELEPNGDQTFITIFITVAILVLLIASVNYINLSIVQALNRSKEVGIRKVSGAFSNKLITQFLFESLLICVISFLVAVATAEALIPMINQRFDHHLETIRSLPLPIIGIMLSIAMVVGILAGLYPAFYLSAFKPVDVLKGVFSPGSGNLWIRKSLVVLQFAISIALITGAMVVVSQVDFLRNRDLGFSKDQVIVLQNTAEVQNNESLKASIRKAPGVLSVGASNGVLGGQNWTTYLQAKGSQEGSLVNFTFIDTAYLNTMGVHLKAGRNFIEGQDNSNRRGGRAIVNEKAVKDLGIKGDPIGAFITDDINRDTVRWYEVIGVAKDFHFASLRSEIKPYAFLLQPDNTDNFVVKVNAADVQTSLAAMESSWKEFAGNRPFEYFFLDDNFVKLYKAEDDFRLVFSVFTGLAIYIACSGLFAIATYFIRRRTKEIGIRKVLGASVNQLTWLVSSEFLVIIVLANIIAWPVAWYFMNDWLDGFAYHINVSYRHFLLSGFAGLAIAAITISYQSIKAALTNPVNSLRNE